jgi:hypothetical protein
MMVALDLPQSIARSSTELVLGQQSSLLAAEAEELLLLSPQLEVVWKLVQGNDPLGEVDGVPAPYFDRQLVGVKGLRYFDAAILG